LSYESYTYCVEFFALFVFVLRLVCPELSVSLDCPFLIAPSVFSNIYLHKLEKWKTYTNIYKYTTAGNDESNIFFMRKAYLSLITAQRYFLSENNAISEIKYNYYHIPDCPLIWEYLCYTHFFILWVGLNRAIKNSIVSCWFT
jgi:hypothetical protein